MVLRVSGSSTSRVVLRSFWSVVKYIVPAPAVSYVVPVPVLSSPAVSSYFVLFDRAGDSTGGVKDEKGLWLACQSIGNITGGRAHGPTAMLCFVLLDSLMLSLFLS